MRSSILISNIIYHTAVLLLLANFVMADLNDSEEVGYAPGLPNLTEIGLAKLMSLELVVTTIGKRERQLGDIPAAVHIITREEIIRSGAQNIADALRLAPGINVFQMNANNYVVASRGLANELSNKITLLIDGRNCFSPVFGGVPWDKREVILEDIERIEIIRGPGDAVWGSNATNAVINVVTKTARETQGQYAQIGAGSHDTGFFTIRDGGVTDDNIYYKVYTQGYAHGGHPTDSLAPGHDVSKKVRGGFRLDGGDTNSDHWNLQGYAYGGQEDEPAFDVAFEPPYRTHDYSSKIELNGGSLIGEWRTQPNDHTKLMLRSYYDRRQLRMRLIKEYRDIIDVDTIVENVYDRHSFIWGASYRGAYSTVLSRTGSVEFFPPYRDKHEVGLFVQDEYQIIRDTLKLQASVKLEHHNDIVGWEYLPSTRLLWRPEGHHTLWAGITRATNLPGESDQYIKWDFLVKPLPNGQPAVLTGFGNKSLKSEVAIAYELGWRYAEQDGFIFDIATFYSDYNGIKGEVIQGAETAYFEYDPLRVIIPVLRENAIDGGIYGFEVSGRYNPFDFWQLYLGYSYLDNTLKNYKTLMSDEVYEFDKVDPKHKALLSSRVDITSSWAWDTYAYYVDTLVAHNVPSYVRFDTRIGWKQSENLEFELIGQNLFDDKHLEFTLPVLPMESTQAERTFIGRVSYRY